MKFSKILWLIIGLMVLGWVVLQILPPFSRPFASDRQLIDFRPPKG